MKPKSVNKKAIAYVDGFDLYHGVESLKKPILKWLDLAKLCHFIASNEKSTSLVGIKYFTAMVSGETKQSRQQKYLDVLDDCEYLDIIKGKFSSNPYTCPDCEQTHYKPEEKQTDVNIACHLLTDAYDNKVDTAIIISADSDLIPPIKILKARGKRVVVWTPPRRNSAEIKENADIYRSIFGATIKNCLLPNTVKIRTGREISKPEEWC